MTGRRFILEYFKNLPDLLIASSAAVLIPSFLFIIVAQAFNLHDGDGLILLPIMYWVFGHLFAAPGLFFAFLPTLLFLQSNKNGFWSYVGFSTGYAFVNGWIISALGPDGFLHFFIGAGFLTGVFYYLLVRKDIFGENPPPVPFWVSFVVVLVIFAPSGGALAPKKGPCSIKITTEIAGIKLEVPRFYALINSTTSKEVNWGAANFIKSNGDLYWPKQEDECAAKNVAETEVLKMGHVFYSDPNIYNGQYKDWTDRRIAEIKALGNSIEPDSEQVQAFKTGGGQKKYVVLPTITLSAPKGGPIILVCDERKKLRRHQCHTSYISNSGLVVSYSLPNDDYDADELLRIDSLAQAQLNELIEAAKNTDTKKAEFLLPEALHGKSYGFGAPKCGGYKYGIDEKGMSNLTIKLDEDYYRVLLNRNITSSIAVNRNDRKSARDLPCDVDYIEGVSFGVKDKGSLTSIHSWTLEKRKSLFQQHKRQFAEIEDVDGVKEFEIGSKSYTRKIAAISKSLIPTGSDEPAVVSCGEHLKRYKCSIHYQQQGHEAVVSYSKRYSEEYIEHPNYLKIYDEAEKWVNDMRNTANDYHEKTGYR